MKSLGTAVVAVLWMASPGHAGEMPVAMLMQAEGVVEYQKPGKDWKKVQGNKLLFPGDRVRTAAASSGRLMNQASGGVQVLDAESEVLMAGEGIKAERGNLSTAGGDEGWLMAEIQNRFARGERYTTVRRAAKGEETGFAMAKKITLSAAYPDLVWQPACPACTYELLIDGQATPVTASSGDLVRVTVAGLQPGEHRLQVRVLEQGQVLPPPGEENTLTWLSSDEDQAVAQQLAKVKASLGDNPLLTGAVLERHGLAVAAMDHYQRYVAQNREDPEARTILVGTYHHLRLNALKEKIVSGLETDKP